jgi:hypothetical protein
MKLIFYYLNLHNVNNHFNSKRKFKDTKISFVGKPDFPISPPSIYHKPGRHFPGDLSGFHYGVPSGD